MSVPRYLVAILDAFIKWWWAAITGVASILGWMMVPADGVALGRLAVSILVFFGLLLVFLVASVLVKAYPWYAGAVEHPHVIEFVPRAGAAGADEPVCTFVIQEAGWKMTPGHVFGLYSARNEEACVAVVRVDRGRHNDSALQCVPIWIAPAHLRELRVDGQAAKHLIVRREIPENRLNDLVPKHS